MKKIFFSMVIMGLISSPTSLLRAQEQAVPARWRQTVQKRMEIFKKNIGCMFTKKGCTKEQIAKISALIGSIIFVVAVGVGKWKQRYPAQSLYSQDPEAQRDFKIGIRTKSLSYMVEAVENGLIVGPHQLDAIREIYNEKMKKARTTNNAKKMNTALEYKDELRTYFSKPENQDQLQAKPEFWNWIAVYGS